MRVFLLPLVVVVLFLCGCASREDIERYNHTGSKVGFQTNRDIAEDPYLRRDVGGPLAYPGSSY